MVYEKALNLDHEQRQVHSTGAIVSHMQIDAQKLGDSLPYLHMLWSGPVQLGIAIYMLYSYLGPSGFVGLFVMIMMLPLNMKLGKTIGKYTQRTMSSRDKRVKFTNELLQGMRILKLFAWEKPLLHQLLEKRNVELRNIRANLLLGGVISFLFTATPLLVTLATFALYTILGNKMTAATAFTALSLFNILRFPLLVIPMMITRVVDLMVVNRRLSRFFGSPDRKTVMLDADGQPERSEPMPPIPATPTANGDTSTRRRARVVSRDAALPPREALVFEGHFRSPLALPNALAIEVVKGTFKWPETKKPEEKQKGKSKRRGWFGGKQAANEPLIQPAEGAPSDAVSLSQHSSSRHPASTSPPAILLLHCTPFSRFPPFKSFPPSILLPV